MDFTAILDIQPADRRTSVQLANANTISDLNASVLSDYGFDNNIYILAKQRIPTEEQLQNLWNKYQSMILEMGKPIFIETLHNNLKNLPDILGEDFQWVCNISNLLP